MVSDSTPIFGQVVALAGGVGGAKMAQGLDRILPAGDLSIVVNTADDFELFGLRICPDLDTVLYTLGGIANPATGWGIAGDTRATLDAIGRFGRDLWFTLGDQDFATHILRTERLRNGEPLSRIMADFASALGVHAALIPMTDSPVATMIRTPHGLLDFQDYFVARRQQDDVVGVEFAGVASAAAQPAAIAAIARARVIVFCPSNPIVSVGPILAVPGLRDAISASSATRVAVSPIIGGKAIKGPADRMLATLGHEVSALGVARIYQGLIDGFVIDRADEALTDRIEALGMRVLATNAMMGDAADRARLAAEVLAFSASISKAGVPR